LLDRASSPSTSVRPADPPALKSGRYLLGVWIILAILTPLMGFLGARGFAPLVGVAGLLCLPLARPRDMELAGLILFSLIVEWAVISAFWSPAPLPHTLHAVGRFTGLHIAQQLLFCGALIITARTLPPVIAGKALMWMTGGLLVLAAILLFESLTDALLLKTVHHLVGQKPSGITHWELRAVAQGGYALAALFWPAAVSLEAQGRRRLLAVFAALCLVDFALLDISALILALLVSAAVFALVRWRGRVVALACMAVASLQVVVVPWFLYGITQSGAGAALAQHLPRSWAARVRIWTFASAHMAQKPLTGWGLDASRTFGENIPLHPHDASLQLWFELGVPGAVLGALAWGFVFWQFARAAPDRRRFAATGCAVGTVCLTIGAFSFGLWQEWWICLMALGFAASMLVGRQSAGTEELAHG
jgi:O-antigen ligase